MRSTICVTVGCNVNGAPHWDGAYVRNALLDTLYDACHVDYHADPEPICYSIGSIVGEWEGVQERSIIWTGTVPTSFLPQVRRSLSFLAEDLQQDAIGIICQPDTETLLGAAEKGRTY